MLQIVLASLMFVIVFICMEFEIIYSISVKKICWDFDRDFVWISFVSMIIFTTLIPPIHKHKGSFCILLSSSTSFFNVLNYKYLTPLVIFIVMDFVFLFCFVFDCCEWYCFHDVFPWHIWCFYIGGLLIFACLICILLNVFISCSFLVESLP